MTAEAHAAIDRLQVSLGQSEAGAVDVEESDQSQRFQLPPIYRGTEIEQLPRPVPLVEGILNRQTIGEIYGPSGAGKTFYALALALSVVSGRDFFGREVHQGPVLFIAAEGVSGLQLRQRAWMQHHAATELEIEGMHWMPQSIDLRIAEHVNVVGDYMDKHGIVLVIFDTLNRNMPGTDEGAVDMGYAHDALTVLSRRGGQATAVAIHHTGKDPGRGSRGHTSFKGALDSQIEITGGDGLVIATQKKQRDHEEGPPLTWGLEKVEVTVGDETHESATLSIKLNQPKTHQNLTNVLKVLSDLDDGTATGVANGVWHEACNEQFGMSRSTFERARAAATKQRLVTQAGARKPWNLTPMGRTRVATH